MEIEQLRYFLKVAELGNFTKAGIEIGLSQPALSRSIAKLEQELGQPIFERQTRKVSLTDAGSLLQKQALKIISLVENTKAEITDDGKTGTIRLASIPTVAPYFLPHVIRPFVQNFPDASLEIQEDTTENILRMLNDGVVDLAVAALPIESPYLEVEELFEEELWLSVCPGHELATKQGVALEDIDGLPFILLNEAHCLSDNVFTFCRQKSFHPISVQRTNQLETIKALVSLGHGISLVPEMAKKTAEEQEITYLSLKDEKPKRTIVMVFNPYRFQSKLLKGMRQLVMDLAGSWKEEVSVEA